jgi:hypothetical protein
VTCAGGAVLRGTVLRTRSRIEPGATRVR